MAGGSEQCTRPAVIYNLIAIDVGLLMNSMNYYIIYSNNNVLLYVMGLLKPLKTL